jgi:hypothetical protein
MKMQGCVHFKHRYLINGRMLEVCASAGTANWHRYRWKVKAHIDRAQKEQVAPGTQDWARFGCALNSAISVVY